MPNFIYLISSSKSAYLQGFLATRQRDDTILTPFLPLMHFAPDVGHQSVPLGAVQIVERH